MSLTSPSKINNSRKGWSIIEKMVPFTHAIGRIDSRGSCILISLPCPANSTDAEQHGAESANRHEAVLLTTSFVLPSREVTAGRHATFLEQPVAGTSAKWDVEAVTVPIRGDRVFYCSAKDPQLSMLDRATQRDERVAHAYRSHSIDNSIVSETVLLPDSRPVSADGDDEHGTGDTVQVEELGYCVVSCAVQSDRDARLDLRRIRPLPLPLILSKLPSIQVGDIHLIVTHENSQTRRYVVGIVSEVHDSHCAYRDADPACHFSSGGAVFSSSGDFIGLNHQCGEQSYCVYIRGVVRHLFDSGMLGLCRIPVLTGEPSLEGDGDDAEDPELHPNRPISDAEHNDAFHVAQRMRLLDVGAGDQLVSFDDIQIARNRKLRGTTLPDSLRIRRHMEIWAEWFDPSDYRTLVQLLLGFPYQSRLCELALNELTSHGNRNKIESVSRLGGIGIMLEVLDSHPHDRALVQTAVTSLARVSLYDANRESIARSDGIPVTLSVLREFFLHHDVCQWCCYLILNLVSEGQRAQECVVGMMQYAGLETMLHTVTKHRKGRHLTRWALQCVGYIVEATQANADVALGLGALRVVLTILEEYWKDSFVLCGPLATLHRFCRPALVAYPNRGPPGSALSEPQSLAACIALLECDFPLSRPLPPAKPGDDEDDEEVMAQRRAEGEKLLGGDGTRPAGGSITSVLLSMLDYHSRAALSLAGGDTANVVEMLLLILLDVLTFSSLPGIPEGLKVPTAAEKVQVEQSVVQATQALMTEVRIHTIGERVLRFVGVSDPFGQYSHLQRERNAPKNEQL